MIKIVTYSVLSLLILLGINGCEESATKKTHQGIAVITSVTDVDSSLCTDAVVVKFRFTPGEAGNYLLPNILDDNISLACHDQECLGQTDDQFTYRVNGTWSEEIGIYEGATFETERVEVTGGTAVSSAWFSVTEINTYLVENNGSVPAAVCND